MEKQKNEKSKSYCPHKHKWGTANQHCECELCPLWESCVCKKDLKQEVESK